MPKFTQLRSLPNVNHEQMTWSWIKSTKITKNKLKSTSSSSSEELPTYDECKNTNNSCPSYDDSLENNTENNKNLRIAGKIQGHDKNNNSGSSSGQFSNEISTQTKEAANMDVANLADIQSLQCK